MAINIPIISTFQKQGIQDAVKQFKALETRAEKFQFIMAKATSPAGLTVMAGAAVAAGKVIFDLANEAAALGETQNKVDSIFKDSARQFDDWSESAAKAFGQSKQQALDGVSTFGIFGRAAGLSGDNLVAFSTTLTELAADLASFNNTSVDDALTALAAGLRGEQEPLRRFGVLLDDATLRQAALRKGLIDTTSQALTPQQKVLAAYDEILKQTSIQQGDFTRTSESLANQQRILDAETKNLRTELGQKFQPIVNDVTSSLIDLVDATMFVGDRFGDLFQEFENFGDATLEMVSQLPGLGFLWDETSTSITAAEDSAINATASFNRLKNELLGVFDALYYGQEPLNWMTQIGLPNLNDHLEGLGFDTTIDDASGFGRSLQELETPLQKFLKTLAETRTKIRDAFANLFNIGSIYGDSNNFRDFMGNVRGVVGQIKNYGANLLKLQGMGLGPLAIQGIMQMDLATGSQFAADLLAQSNVLKDIRQLNQAYGTVGGVAGQVGAGLALGQTTGVTIGNVYVQTNDPKKLVEGLRQYGRNSGPLPIAVTGSF
jgi:hypothetical protein